MPSTDYRTPRRIRGIKSKNPGSPFDDLAKEYDAWFDKEGIIRGMLEVVYVCSVNFEFCILQ